jgi:UDP-glucose 4-epimerase
MRMLVTGSAGHLGEALVRSLREQRHDVVGIDVLPSTETSVVGSILDQDLVRRCMQGIDVVMHGATLHKPHVATHSKQEFIDVNITGTLNLLEAAAEAKVASFIFSSTTSSFGDALAPPPTTAAVWITEDVAPQPKNIYGASKCAAEDLCKLFARNHGLACVVLKLSRFFPEVDDDPNRARKFDLLNLQINELLNRRVDIADVVSAHLAAMDAAQRIGFGKFIISATSPFEPSDLMDLRGNVARVLRQRVPEFEAIYQAKGWQMLDDMDRVYVNARARQVLNWKPQYEFAQAITALAKGDDPRSAMAQSIPMKGYHRV